MTDAHTPGPWTRYEDGLNGEDGLDIIMARIGDENYDIAAICEDQPATVRKANSRLIAAAPDMLAALDRLLQAVHYELQSGNGFGSDIGIEMDAAHKAIAAARGK